MSKKSNLSLLTLAALFTMSAHAEETIPGTTYYVGAPGGDVGYDYTFEVCQDDVCLDYPSVGGSPVSIPVNIQGGAVHLKTVEIEKGDETFYISFLNKEACQIDAVHIARAGVGVADEVWTGNPMLELRHVVENGHVHFSCETITTVVLAPSTSLFE